LKNFFFLIYVLNSKLRLNISKMLHSVMVFKKAAFAALAISFIIVLHLPVCAQPTFQLAIGMESFEKGSAIKVLGDHGFVITGETESYGLHERDMLLMRTDSLGNVKWTKTYGGAERETVNDVLQTPDHGFILTSEKYQPRRQEGEHLTLLKTDSSGNLKWKKIYDEGGNETEGFSMQHTPDNAYVVTGMVKSLSTVSSSFFTMSAEDQNLYLIKVNEAGDKLWSRQFSYGNSNVASTGTSVIVAGDGSYVIAGNVAKQGKTDKKIEKPAHEVNMQDQRSMLLAKVKPNGKLQWAREYTANSITMGYTVIEKHDGGFIVVGNTNVAADNLDICVMSTDANGNVQWAKTFGGPHFESVADVVQVPDGGFVVTGMTYSMGAGSSDILNFKVDGKGNLLWAKTYGGKNEEYPSKLVLTKDGIVIVGSTGSFNSESFDVLLMKTDWDGNSACLSAPATVSVGSNFTVTAKGIGKSAMTEVDQGITPPNIKKPDANSILEGKRQTRTKGLCH
jgi:hypothetical protein